MLEHIGFKKYIKNKNKTGTQEATDNNIPFLDHENLYGNIFKISPFKINKRIIKIIASV